MISALEQELIDVLSPEFSSISEEGDVETKDAVLAGFASGDVSIESIDCDQYTVRVYGDTAVRSHRAVLKGAYRVHDISSTYRTTHVWVRRDTGWQIVGSQKTRIAEGSR